MLSEDAENILKKMACMGFAGAGEALHEIERQQVQICLLRAVVRELAPYPNDRLPPHIKMALEIEQ